MKHRLILTLLMLLSFALGSNAAQAQDTPQARLRVIHAIGGAPEVDIYIDNSLATGGLGFGEATPHFRVNAGSNQVDVRPQGSDPTAPPLFSQVVDVQADLAFSLVLQGSQTAPEAIAYEDVLDPLDAGLSRLAAIHAVTGAGAVDILRTDGAPLMLSVNYSIPYGTINIPAGAYEVVAAPTGGTPDSAITPPITVDLRTNTSYTLLLLPNANGAEFAVFASPVNPAVDTVLARVADAATDLDAVDVYLDETLILTNLTTGQVSQHVGFTKGEHELSLREAGSPPNSDAIFSDTVTLVDPAQTIALSVDEDGKPVLTVLTDDTADVTPEKARLQVVNLSGEAVNLETADGETIADGLASGEVGDALELTPATVSITGDSELEGVLYGGALYSVIAFPDGEFVLASTPINIQLSSAPAAQGTTVAAAQPTATLPAVNPAAPTEQAAQPTATLALPTPVATAQTSQPLPAAPTVDPAAAQAAPSTLATPTPVAPIPPVAPPSAVQPNARPTKAGIYPPVDIIFGVVNLNQGVNLQCREYPSTAARSLGLIPNGTELVIVGLFAPRDETSEIGRTDALIIDGIPDFTPLLDNGDEATGDPGFQVTDFDPAFLAQFKPENLWLNVDWALEDGTAFGCWTNAKYVLIDYDDKRIDEITEYLQLVKNLNFDLTPYNVPGGPRDPDVVVSPQQVSQPTPLPANDQIIALVNVNRGVNLQFRRTPGVDGESLALVPGGSQMTVIAKVEIPPTGNIGEPTIPEWLYAEILQADGTRLRGWLSGEYVSLTQKGRVITLAEVPTASVVERGGIVTDDGVVEGAGAAPAPAPAAAQFVGRLLTDPGASLNLRDQPIETGLVRASIPSGTTLTVLGRNGAGTWLNVVFASPNGDVAGWVVAELIGVSNPQGTPVEIGKLPIVNGEPDTFNPNALPLAPTPAS